MMVLDQSFMKFLDVFCLEYKKLKTRHIYENFLLLFINDSFICVLLVVDLIFIIESN